MNLLLKGVGQGCGSELIYVCLSKLIERDTVGCENEVQDLSGPGWSLMIIATTI